MALPNFISVKDDPTNEHRYIEVYTVSRKVVSFPDYTINITQKVNLPSPLDY